MRDFVEHLNQVVGPSLDETGFQRVRSGWIRSSEGVFNAFSAFAGDGRQTATFGWRYADLGDPEPDPPDARGCLHRLPLDLLAPTSDLRSLLAYPDDAQAIEVWERRLQTAWRAAVVPWLNKWWRPDGYRDFLASRGMHLGAAWVSAVLGHRERTQLELEQAHLAIGQPLDSTFDRARAERDAAIAAPFATRHGLAEYLGQDGLRAEVRDAFISSRGATAQSKITSPDLEHRRLQQRAAVFAELCRRHVADDQSGRQ